MTNPHDESTDLQLPPADLALATQLARNRGIVLETYLKMLIHEALTRESKAS